MCSNNCEGVVPWYNSEQFYKVYQYLYSTDLSQKRWAVDQISVWETRCHPSLPTAVEATFVIVRAMIQDALFENGATLCQERDIQMIYAMALVRFVSLTIEVQQINNRYKVHSSVIANDCKIPAWIVTLRHEATHSLCPSLPVLRMGAEAAMQYLNKTFWMPQASCLNIWIKSPEANEEEIRNLINTFQIQQCDKLMKGIPMDADDECQQDLFQEISLAINQLRRKFIEVLVQADNFILSEDLMKDILKDDEKKFLYDDTDYSLPKTFEDFWMPIIVVLHSFDLIPTFLEVLLATQENRELIEQKYAIAWVIRIIQSVALFDKRNSLLSYIFEEQGSVFDWSKLLFLCLKYPCKYTAFLFPILASLLELNEEWTRRYMCLIAIYQGQAIDSSNFPMEDHIFTVKDIERYKKRKYSPKKENVWTVASDHIDFSKLPIGAILNSCMDEKPTSSEEILEDEAMNIGESVERFILSNENDKEQDDENIDINSFKKDEQTNSSKNEEKVFMVYKRRRK